MNNCFMILPLNSNFWKTLSNIYKIHVPVSSHLTSEIRHIFMRIYRGILRMVGKSFEAEKLSRKPQYLTPL